jgi:hypothetical protein
LENANDKGVGITPSTTNPEELPSALDDVQGLTTLSTQEQKDIDAALEVISEEKKCDAEGDIKHLVSSMLSSVSAPLPGSDRNDSIVINRNRLLGLLPPPTDHVPIRILPHTVLKEDKRESRSHSMIAEGYSYHGRDTKGARGPGVFLASSHHRRRSTGVDDLGRIPTAEEEEIDIVGAGRGTDDLSPCKSQLKVRTLLRFYFT